MKSSYSNHELSEKEEIKLWEECVFVFDSSALLNFYEYSEATRRSIFETTFKALKNRLWIPDWVNREFLRNREKTLRKPNKYYAELKDQHLKTIESHLTQIKNKTKTNNKHPHLNPQPIHEFEEQFQQFKDALERDIESQIIEIENMSQNDTLLSGFKSFFEVGEEYDYNQITEIIEEGEFRYRNSIPPGYMDEADKTGFQKFGDLIIWKQILHYAKKIKKPIILITDDRKEDWWILRDKKTTLGPREELIDEIVTVSNVGFWMYDSSQFLEKSKIILDTKIDEEVISEVKLKSVQWYGFTAEHAFVNWAIQKYADQGEILAPQGRMDSGVDTVLLHHDGSTTGFVVKYLRADNLGMIEFRIKRAIEIIPRFGRKYDKLVIVFITSDEAIANRIYRDLSDMKKQTKLFESELKEPDFIVGYLDEYQFLSIEKSR